MKRRAPVTENPNKPSVHALSPLVNLQLEYSLAERHIEHKFVPLAQQTGMGITAWSPLAMGLLSGKYKPGESGGTGEGRLAKVAAAPGFERFTERNWRIVAALEQVAREAGRPMAQVALNWAANRPGIASVIVGATQLEQLNANLAALDFALPADLLARLDTASTPECPFPYYMFADVQQTRLHGGVAVGDKPEGYAPPVFVGAVPARNVRASR